MIVIIDYEVGNLGSILNMLKKAGVKAMISSSLNDIAEAKKLILPGVGSFDHGMRNLEQLNLIPALNSKVFEQKTPILAICLGMQLLTRGSEEGTLPGLGWIQAKTVKFLFPGNEKRLKIPHMGWNHVTVQKPSLLFAGMYAEPRFYFVHSYHVVCQNEEDILTKTFYGYNFVSSIKRSNIFGVQFHPEKSHKFGMKLLKNFAEIN